MQHQYFPRSISTLAFVLFTSLALQASPLASLLEQYRSSSPNLKAEALRVESMREQVKASTAFPAPEISFEWGSRAVSPGMSNETMFYGGVLLGQEFMFPGKRNAMFQAEAERSNMAQADYQAIENNGAFRLAQYYLEIHMTQARMVVLDSTLAVVSSILESAQRRFETGMGTMEDLFRLKAELARLRSDSLFIVGEQGAMRVMLAASLGSSALISISDSIDFLDDITNVPTLDSLLQITSHRPELASMSAGKRMATKEYNAAKLRKMPDLMLQGRYMTMMGPDEWSVMAGVKVPIAPWSSTEYQSAENASKAREQEALAREQAMTIMLKQEVNEAYTRLQTAQGKLKQVKEEQVVTAENALRSAQIAYSSGKSDLTMSLDALRMALMAWDESVMAHMNVLQSILNLEKSAGVNPGTWLMETTVSTGESK